MGKSSALKRKQSKTKGFSVGDEVEVQSEDEGFRGAWYEATVVRPLPRHRRHSVVYTSLLEDTVSCRPLHEYVLDSHLRPRHPRRPGPPFQIHQIVDAFHQDGWWPGVVADVRGGRYAVYFPSTREEEEFVESDVRAHLRWVKGQWIIDSEDSPGRTKNKFSVRDQVEVTRDKEIFGAAWYTGTIVKVIGKTYFLIEYTSLLQGSGCGGQCEFLREIVDAQYIRPSPSHKPEAMKFDLFDEVEAFWTNYWLPGVIIKVLSESMYVVKPTYIKEELELNAIDLRHHYNWTNGQWVRVTQGEFKKTIVGSGNKLSSCRKPKAHKMPDFPSPISKTADGEVTLDMCSDTGMLKQENNRKLRLDDRLQFCRDSRKKELAKDNSKLVDFLQIERRSKISEKIGMALDSPHEVEITTLTNEHPQSEGLYRGRMGEGSSVVSKFSPNLSVEILPEQGMPVSKDTVKAPSLEPETYNSKNDMSENKTKALNLILSPSIQENNEFFLSGEWESYCCVSDVGLNLKKRRKKLAVRAPKRQRKILDVVHTAPPGFVGKRGRPRKEGMQVKQAETTADQAVGMDCRKQEAELSDLDPSDKVLDAVQLQCHKNGAERDESSPLHLNNAISGALQGESVTIIHESKVQEQRFDGYNQPHDKHVTSQFNSTSTVEKSVNDPSTKQVSVAMVSSSDRAVEGMSNDGNETSIHEDNQAPSLLGEVTATVQEGLVHDLPSSNKIEMQAVSAENACDLPEKNAFVPFVRSSPMWQTIESMEIFRLLPQEPHFQPLEQHCPEFREGMAVGLMITFANFATSIRSLSITDPLALLNEKLNALATLEANGFKVQRMRHRIEQLLDIKRKQEQFQIKKAASEGQLLDQNNEKGQLSSSIMDFDKAIMELEQKIGWFKEKRSSAIVERELIDSEIAILQRDAEAAEEFLASAEHQFDAAVAAPW